MAAPLTILAVRALLNPTVQKVLFKYGPSFFGGSGLATALARWDRIQDLLASDEELTAAVSGPEGYPVLVTTFSEPFVIQKMQVAFQDADVATTTDDVRVLTIHLAKTSGGGVVDTWEAADFNAAVAAFDAFFTTVKPLVTSRVTYDGVKFYRDGPAIGPPNPPSFEVDKAVGATGGGTGLTPQTAVTVTEMAGTKPHWGRFYLPPLTSAQVNGYGRILLAAQTSIADAADTMYQAFLTANIPAVVYRAPLPERTKKNGTTLPARAGSAWTVDKVQVDDVYDVIRSRRRKYPTLRLQRDIA